MKQNTHYSSYQISSEKSYPCLSSAIDVAERLKTIRNQNFNVIKTLTNEIKVWDDHMVDMKDQYISDTLYTTSNGLEYNSFGDFDTTEHLFSFTSAA